MKIGDIVFCNPSENSASDGLFSCYENVKIKVQITEINGLLKRVKIIDTNITIIDMLTKSFGNYNAYTWWVPEHSLHLYKITDVSQMDIEA